jgi:hypothetical protein
MVCLRKKKFHLYKPCDKVLKIRLKIPRNFVALFFFTG